MRNMFRLLLSLAAVGSMTTNTNAAPLALDYFTSPNTGGYTPIAFAGGSYNQTVGPTANVGDLGASRTIIFTGTDAGVPGGAQFAIGSNIFSYSVPPNDMIQTTMLYTGLASTAFNPAGALFLNLVGVDQPFTIGLDLLSGGNAGTLQATGSYAVPSGDPIVPLFFAGLTGALGNYDTIRIRFNTTAILSLDFDLSAQGAPPVTFEPDGPTVPEPATLATFGLMGLMGGYVARRRMKAGAVAQA